MDGAERVEGATGAEEGLGEYDMSQFMTDGSAGGYQTYQQQETGERRNALDKRSQTLDRKNKFLLNAAVMTTIGGELCVCLFLHILETRNVLCSVPVLRELILQTRACTNFNNTLSSSAL